MKKTEYFISKSHYSHDAKTALAEVVGIRDKFLENNASIIEEIDSENIRIYPVESGTRICVVLSLTYFETINESN